MPLREVLRRSTDYLTQRKVETPRLDAELLLASALGITRLDLYLEHDRPLGERELAACRTLLERRGRREPAAYVLGEWGFRRLTLKVDRRALVPRPETEVVVQRCLELLRGSDEPRVLDVGTGTGAIALAIADEHPGARVTALDASADAVDLAQENATRTGLADRVTILRRDDVAGLPHFDLIVSNPPYVTADEFEGLAPEIQEWEPREALVENGLTETLSSRARDCLVPGGWVVLEVAEDRAAGLARSLEAMGHAAVRVTADLAGRPRVVEGQRRPA
jgi:release factor glutamine methyltransferase